MKLLAYFYGIKLTSQPPQETITVQTFICWPIWFNSEVFLRVMIFFPRMELKETTTPRANTSTGIKWHCWFLPFVGEHNVKILPLFTNMCSEVRETFVRNMFRDAAGTILLGLIRWTQAIATCRADNNNGTNRTDNLRQKRGQTFFLLFFNRLTYFKPGYSGIKWFFLNFYAVMVEKIQWKKLGRDIHVSTKWMMKTILSCPKKKKDISAFILKGLIN